MFRRSILRTNSTINRISSGLLFLLLVAGYSTVALAQERPTLRASFARNQQASIKVDVLVGQSRLIELDEDYERVSISRDCPTRTSTLIEAC